MWKYVSFSWYNDNNHNKLHAFFTSNQPLSTTIFATHLRQIDLLLLQISPFTNYITDTIGYFSTHLLTQGKQQYRYVLPPYDIKYGNFPIFFVFLDWGYHGLWEELITYWHFAMTTAVVSVLLWNLSLALNTRKTSSASFPVKHQAHSIFYRYNTKCTSCKDCLVIFTISAMWYYCEVLSEVLHHSNLCNDFTPQTQGGFPAVAYNSGMVFTCISLLHLWIFLEYSIPCCSVLLHLGLPKPCYCLLYMARYFWFLPPLFYILSALCH